MSGLRAERTLSELESTDESPPGFRVGLSPMGQRLFGFWLIALVLFVAAWAFRPHERGQAPLPLGPSHLAESVLDEPPPPERTGVSKLLHDRLLDRDDSWTAMKLAQRHLRGPSDASVYDTVFELGAKFQYPPSSLLFLELLEGVFGRGVLANPVLNTLSVCFFFLFAVATYLIARPALAPPRRALLDHVLPFLFVALCYPLLKALEIGQIQSYLNGLFALALLCFSRGRTVLAGLLIGVMATIKPQMGLFLVWALLHKEYGFAKAMGGCVAIIGLVSLALYGLKPHLDYLGVLSMISRHGESYYANQSLNGLLLRALHLGPNLAFTVMEFAPYSPFVRYATLLSSLLFISLALGTRWKARGEATPASLRGVQFALVALCFTVASPIAWEHHYGIVPALFAAAFALLRERPHAPRALWFGLAAAWLLLCTRISAVGALADTWLNFLQSHFFFGGLILLAVLYRLCRTSSDLRGTPHAASGPAVVAN